MKYLLRPLLRNVLVAHAVVWMGAFVFAQSLSAQVVVLSPENKTNTVIRCTNDRECPPPRAEVGQDPACLRAQCIAKTCSVGVLNGKELGREEPPSQLSCFKAPLVCDAQGFAVLSTDPRRQTPIREGEYCILQDPEKHPCERSVCQVGACVWIANDGADCSVTTVTTNECQKKVCQNRECRAVADSSREKAPCRNPQTGQQSETSECRTTTYSCNASGVCEPSLPHVASGAECAANPPELAPYTQLPALFLKLIQNSASFPAYSCDSANCKLIYCGDGVLNPPEQCDGDTFPEGTQLNAKCGTDCTIQRCGDNKRSGSESCDGTDIPSTAPAGARCSTNCTLEWCGDNVKNGKEECDGKDTPPGSTCSPQCSLCGYYVVKEEALCTHPPGTNALSQTDGAIKKYWLDNLRFSTYKDAVYQGLTGTLFTYTNEQGQRCWVDHERVEDFAPGRVSGCSEGYSEIFEFHCSTCGETNTTCSTRFPDKPGLKVFELGVSGDGNCVSGAAHAAYSRFKNDYPGYESVLTGVDLGYSADRRGVYGAPQTNKRSSINPRDMVTCEVCYWPVCGNGKRTPDEECDGSDLPSNAPRGSSCNAQCTLEYCGDGKINNKGTEQCDGTAMPPNALPGSTCSADCTFHGSLSLGTTGTCTIEPEGNTATSVFCSLKTNESWSEGKYGPRQNPPTLGQPDSLRTLEERALTSAGQLCQGRNGSDTGFVGTRSAIITSSDVNLTGIGAAYGTLEFLCITEVP